MDIRRWIDTVKAEEQAKFSQIISDKVKEVELLETQKFLDKRSDVADFVKVDEVIKIMKQ
jgi:negative regulator of replication initiation